VIPMAASYIAGPLDTFVVAGGAARSPRRKPGSTLASAHSLFHLRLIRRAPTIYEERLGTRFEVSIRRSAMTLYDLLAPIYGAWAVLTEADPHRRALAVLGRFPCADLLEVGIGTGTEWAALSAD
jgi:hypothetical protein